MANTEQKISREKATKDSTVAEFISEEDIDKALAYLRDNASSAAQARANRLYMEEYRKVVKSEIMQQYEHLAIGAQERNAYADRRYKEHLDVMKTAIYEDEKHRFLMSAAEAKIDAWRTMNANIRAIKL